MIGPFPSDDPAARPEKEEEESMRRAAVVILLLTGSLSACRSDDVLVPVGGTPAAPRALVATYYAGAVTVAWELAPDWDGEAFRVYSRRTSDPSYFFVAEVTSCS